jgi:hypothetical protein
MTTFCVKSVDHCKKLVSENEGKSMRISSLFECIILLELRGPKGGRGERGYPGLPGMPGLMGPIGPQGNMTMLTC